MGLGQTPPPLWEFSLHNTVFFLTTYLGQTPSPDYYEKMHKFTAVVELPKNFTKIMGDGALVVDLDVSFPDGQSGNEVQVLTTGPKLEYFNFARDWFNAENYCVYKGGHLASVPSSYHWRRLQDFISEQGLEKDLWLGGSDEKVEGDWRWSDGNKWWSDEEIWYANMPTEMKWQNCLKTRYRKWYQRECSDELAFVCGIPSTERILKDTQLLFTSENLTTSGIQFSWVSQPLKKGQAQKTNVLMNEKVERTWVDAEAQCASKGGHLASVSSLDDWDKLKSYLKSEKLTKTRLWLGGTRGETGGNWTWSDGRKWFQVTGRNDRIDDYERSKNCVNIFYNTRYKDWSWYNTKCSYKSSKYPSICNVTEEDDTTSNQVNVDTTIGGFNVTWKLLRSNSFEEVATECNNNECKKELWRTKKHDLRSRNWVMVFIMSLVQKSQMANIGKEQVSEAVLRQRWNTDVVLDSPCLNESQILSAIFKSGDDLGITVEDTPWIRDDDLEFATELFTALRDCPEHLIESAKMFFFFEHLIKHHSLETLIASTMNNIAPRADKNIKDFSAVNLWYTRLDGIFNFELAPVLDVFSTTQQQRSMRDSNPPFLTHGTSLIDEKQETKAVPNPSGRTNIILKLYFQIQVIPWLR